MFSIDQVEPIQDDIDRTIMEERMRYSNVYSAIESYMVKFSGNDAVMIGGRIGVQLVLGRPRSTDTVMFHYELYAENPFKHANDLTNEITKTISPNGYKDGDYIIWLKTFDGSGTPGNPGSYGIYVDNRNVATVNGVLRGTVSIVQPIRVKSFDGKRELLALPAEIQLMDIYRVLYVPGNVELWKEYLSDENQLFQLLREREKIVRGAADKHDSLSHAARTQIVNTVLQGFIANNTKVILVGEHALKILDNEPIKTNILQICTTMDADQLITALQLLPDMPTLEMTDRSMDIPKDHRLHRITIKSEGKEILYAYNSPTYELIPFNSVKSGNHFIQIGNPFVVLRFLLIELWTVRRLLSKGKIEEAYAKARMSAMLGRALKLRKLMSEGSASDRSVTTISDSYFNSRTEPNMQIFQMAPNDYIGIYVSEAAHIKRTADEKKKYPDYMPQRHFREAGEYRKIGSK